MADKKAALYIRLSKEDLDVNTSSEKMESNSVTNQRSILRDFYDAHEELHIFEPVEFVDDGYSGTDFVRPQFDAMLRLIRAGEIKCIIIKDLSRLGRNYLEVGNYLDMILPLYGIRFISVTDNFDTDSFKGSTGGLEIALRNLINALYSADLSKKIRSTMRTRNRRGDYGGGSAFYGYQLDPQNKKHLVVDETVRPIIEMIFRDCISGLTQRQIAEKLNVLGIPSPLAYKRQIGGLYNGYTAEDQSIWIQGVIRRILTDERYTGKMVSNTSEPEQVGSKHRIPVSREEWIVVPDTHEAIITDETFTKAQAALKSRQRGSGQTRKGHRNSGFFICGYCGRRLQKHIGTADIYMCCPKADTVKGIPCESIHASLAELKTVLLTLLQTNSAITLPSSLTTSSSEVDLARIREERKRASDENGRFSARKAFLYEKYRSGKLTRAGYLDAQKADAERRRKNEMIISNCDAEEQRILAEKAVLEASSSGYGSFFSTYSDDAVRALIQSARIFDDQRIEVQFTFDDRAKKEMQSPLRLN